MRRLSGVDGSASAPFLEQRLRCAPLDAARVAPSRRSPLPACHRTRCPARRAHPEAMHQCAQHRGLCVELLGRARLSSALAASRCVRAFTPSTDSHVANAGRCWSQSSATSDTRLVTSSIPVLDRAQLVLHATCVMSAAGGRAACVSVISTEVSRAASAARIASARTSSATTANPRPASPARAASTAALSASRLVWKAISSIDFTIDAVRAPTPSCAHRLGQRLRSTRCPRPT
jgi:hypothetical protein